MTPYNNFIIKFEGGPLDGEIQTAFHVFDRDELVETIFARGHTYDLDHSRVSHLPPTEGVVRGAVYTYRVVHPMEEAP